MHRILVAFLACLAFSVPALATTLAELDARYEQASRVEADLLDQIAMVRRNVEDTSLILMGEAGGHVQGYSRADIAAMIDRAIDRASILGLDDAYFSRLNSFEAIAAKVALASGLAREKAIARLSQKTEELRIAEREKLEWLEQELDVIRVTAAHIFAERERMRTFVQTGTMPDSDDTVSNSVCDNDAIPVQHKARYWKSGYGGGPHYSVKGQIICREWSWFHFMTGAELWQFDCDREGNCVRNLDRTQSYEMDKTDEGHPILRLQDGGTITLLPPGG